MDNESKELNWSSLSVPIPENISSYNPDMQTSIYNYLCQLNPIQQKAYLIAKDHLGTSFNIVRSTGYQEWVKHSRK